MHTLRKIAGTGYGTLTKFLLLSIKACVVSSVSNLVSLDHFYNAHSKDISIFTFYFSGHGLIIELTVRKMSCAFPYVPMLCMFCTVLRVEDLNQ